MSTAVFFGVLIAWVAYVLWLDRKVNSMDYKKKRKGKGRGKGR